MFGLLGIVFGGAAVTCTALKHAKFNTETKNLYRQYGAEAGHEADLWLRNCTNTLDRLYKIASFCPHIKYTEEELRYIENDKNIRGIIEERYEEQTGRILDDR